MTIKHKKRIKEYCMECGKRRIFKFSKSYNDWSIVEYKCRKCNLSFMISEED